MKRWMILTALVAWGIMMLSPKEGVAEEKLPRVLLETSMGDILLELDADRTPKTVENFLGYVRDGAYDGTIFHRVIQGFMIQGGGMTVSMEPKKIRAPIQNEADVGRDNQRGTIAMARTDDPHSATAQFFINTSDNGFLNHRDKSVRGWGYCAFGRVVQGMEVAVKIEQVATTSRHGHQVVPVEPVVIQRVRRVN